MLDVSTQTVINVFDGLPEPTRLPLGKVICIDEFHFSNANYASVTENPQPFVIYLMYSSAVVNLKLSTS